MPSQGIQDAEGDPMTYVQAGDCVKCGKVDPGSRRYEPFVIYGPSEPFSVEYLPASGPPFAGPDLLRFTCPRCGYQWTKPTLDAE